MNTVDVLDLKKLAPNANELYKNAFVNSQDDLINLFGLNTQVRFNHFMAQVLHESGGFTHLTENLNYSAKRMVEVWPKRISRAKSLQLDHNPKALANCVYADRMGNGNEASGDGWKYRGRGPIQITGKEMYKKIGVILGVDLVSNPDLILDPKYILLSAGAYWKLANCNAYADRNDIKGLTKSINGGYNGIADRSEWKRKVDNILK